MTGSSVQGAAPECRAHSSDDLKYGNSRDALQIRKNVDQLPHVKVDHLAKFLALIKSDLHDQVSIRFEESRCIGQQSVNDY
jgi:hypothetical protein